ncbi:hypothetical protein L1049_002146 [Liquidambar formosana]|uniref:Myb-like domain-containing protein n=1 Tax=Liquidambar formosana TaxID=63359 RepID=A0AAP0R6F4_LIQFO
MLGISTFPENSGDATGRRENEESGGGSVSGVFGEEERVRSEEGDRNSGGNRWPREETLALLKIRSEMDVAFRDSGLKAPLWEDVSRKLAELGYHRSAKKCKEKFENIYKYHRRTKEGRSGRPNGKMYRFFEQLEALDSNPSLPPLSPDKIQPISMAAAATTAATTNTTNVCEETVPCVNIQNPSTEIIDASTSTTSSSGKESKGTRKRKRRLSDFFERLMKDVIEKQESLQKTFIEAMEKYEQDRIAREEAWKMQEMARIKREHDLLVQERSIAAAKDAAVIAFLQKFSEQAIPSPVQLSENLTPVEKSNTIDKQENSTGEINYTQTTSSSSRWPKAEVEALIRLRTNFDQQYQENGPKGPLWEEISSAMKKIGYDRSAKRCKEKWENINKYFKRVKESNKKRPEDSKTCPYFHQLDALYKEKSKKVDNSENSGYNFKPEDLLMQMMGGGGQTGQEQQTESVTEDGGESENNVDQNQEEINGDEDDNEDEDERDDYRIVANDPSSMAIMG